MDAGESKGSLAGLRVLDLSRVLAGPWASQTLGDLGATVFKVEQPGGGDDTRRWGPPFLDDGSKDAAYFLCCNRNKKALAIDLATPEGAALVRRLAASCDVVIENFRVGGLEKYGLDYASLSRENSSLVYCSVTGFGQTGPYRDRGGYDFLIQGMSGLMSVTGVPDGDPGAGPMKTGIAVSDLFTGLYAVISILAALRHREKTGEGQHIDCALLDSQLSVMVNQASNYLNGGIVPRPLGNQHPNVVPYQDFRTRDGSVLVALGNDRQFRDFCGVIGRQDLSGDARFADISGRSRNRDDLVSEIGFALAEWQSDEFLTAMEKAKLPAGPLNRIDEILEDPHVEARGLINSLEREDGTSVKFIGFPAILSQTPATYRLAPPRMGHDTHMTLANELGIDEETYARLKALGVVADAD
jgi:crotonobetainyl-CoA:carnitine CoA-transferase CaiB-like acyl-CoA transferase